MSAATATPASRLGRNWRGRTPEVVAGTHRRTTVPALPHVGQYRELCDALSDVVPPDAPKRNGDAGEVRRATEL